MRPLFPEGFILPESNKYSDEPVSSAVNCRLLPEVALLCDPGVDSVLELESSVTTSDWFDMCVFPVVSLLGSTGIGTCISSGNCIGCTLSPELNVLGGVLGWLVAVAGLSSVVEDARVSAGAEFRELATSASRVLLRFSFDWSCNPIILLK
jgi:hypothetical protein